MADNPITTPLPADLPTDWVYGQTVGPQGTDVGLTKQHGYNYLMQQVNAAQQAATQIGEAFSGLPSLGSDGKIPKSQIPDLTAEDVGAVPMDEVGKPGGVASLDNNGVVPGDQMPGYTQVSSNTAMGQSSYGGPLSVSNIQGNTVLGGTPAYDAPVSMNSVESPITLNVSGKNIIAPKWHIDTQTQVGVTCTRNGNFFTVDGLNTAQSGVNFYIQRYDTETSFSLPAGTYTISGMPPSEELNLFLGLYQWLPEGESKILARDYGNSSYSEQTFTLTEATDNLYFIITVLAGKNADSVTIAPQIEVGSKVTDYEEPSNTIVEIQLVGPDNESLSPLMAAYAGTGSDVTTLYADRIVRRNGLWMIERNVKEFDLTNASWMKSTNYMSPFLNGHSIQPDVPSNYPLCTHFAARENLSSQSAGIWIGLRMVVGNEVLPNGADTTIDEMRTFCAEQADAGTPVRVCTPLFPPIYEELHSDVQVILSALTVPSGTCSVWFEGDVLPISADISLPRGDFPCADVTGAYLLLNQHMQNQDNPHGVTAEQVGADAAGSAATVQTNLTNHINNKNNPHGVTAAQIGAIASSGGSLSGPLNFANSTWNNVGDDAAFGDKNIAGNFCVKALNGSPGITLFSSDESQSYQVFGQHNISLLMSQIAANGGCRIVTGSYAGTGSYGNASPTSIQFPFPAKYVGILTSKTNDGTLYIQNSYILVPSVPVNQYGPVTSGNGPFGQRTAYQYNSNQNTLYWYSTQSAADQCNQTDTTYYWIALG